MRRAVQVFAFGVMCGLLVFTYNYTAATTYNMDIGNADVCTGVFIRATSAEDLVQKMRQAMGGGPINIRFHNCKSTIYNTFMINQELVFELKKLED
jgi:hypothetical protein